MFLIRGMERDRLLLLQVVLDGQFTWRKRFLNAYKVIHADEEFSDAVFRYLVILAGPNPDGQKAILEGLEQQRQRETWDKRLSTLLTYSKDRQNLEDAINKELRKPKRAYIS